MMKLQKRIQHGQVIPFFYGIAWKDWVSNEAVCYPVPVNMLVAVSRSFFIWMKHGFLTRACDGREAFNQGMVEGLRMAEKNDQARNDRRKRGRY
jgi:hypothetical protein